MRRTTGLKTAAAGSALALLAVGAAAALAERPEPTGVVNKNGKQVDEHAASGQERAAGARALRLLRAAERAAEKEADDAEDSEKGVDNGNHSGPDEAAGDHPHPKAFENPRPHEPRGPVDGAGPDEHAGDHPNVNATDGPGNRGRGGQ